MMGEEEMEHSGCETNSPAAHPSLVVLEPIRKKEPHCCPPTPVILCGRNQEGTGTNERFRSARPTQPRLRARIGVHD